MRVLVRPQGYLPEINGATDDVFVLGLKDIEEATCPELFIWKDEVRDWLRLFEEEATHLTKEVAVVTIKGNFTTDVGDALDFLRSQDKLIRSQYLKRCAAGV